MGEAGPEAVMPLTRMPNGELGVRGMPGGAGSAPAGPANVFNIDARGADREGLYRLGMIVQRVEAKQNHMDRNLEARAINAINWRRSRGPW